VSYNWRNVLVNYAATSQVLAGFTVTLIAFILGWKVADAIVFPLFGITWGHFGVLFGGVASALFVSASEFFLRSKECDMWALSHEYVDSLKEGDKNWDTTRKTSLRRCRDNEGYGRWCYNVAIILLFFSLGCVIAPYQSLIAILVTAVGILLQAFQAYLSRSKD
jgi:hypothetical protein